MIREYFMLFPYLLVSVSYPMIVFYQTESLGLTVLFAVGNLLISLSILFLIFLPYREAASSSNPLSIPSHDRAEVFFNDDVEKYIDVNPPRAPDPKPGFPNIEIYDREAAA